MRELSAMTSLDVWPLPTDVAVVHLPGGGEIHVHQPGTSGEGRRIGCDPGEPLIATIPGDRRLLGWGVTQCLYGSLRGVRNGRHRRDRAIWHEAADAVRDGGVAYVEHERQDWYGKQIWVAVRVRISPAVPSDGGDP